MPPVKHLAMADEFPVAGTADTPSDGGLPDQTRGECAGDEETNQIEEPGEPAAQRVRRHHVRKGLLPRDMQGRSVELHPSAFGPVNHAVPVGRRAACKRIVHYAAMVNSAP